MTDRPTQDEARRQFFYGGQWHAALGTGTIALIDPATGRSLGSVADGTEADVDRAVRAAHGAFPAWSALRPLERAERLRALAALLRRDAPRLAAVDAENCGSPIAGMLRDVEVAALTLELFAGLVTEIKGETIPMGGAHLNYTVREPLGVAGCIVAFNHPILFAVTRAAAALAAGNTVVLKPADQTPLSALCLADLVAETLPPGVFNLVTGSRLCGAALAAHPLVAKLSLVGSVPTGKAILRAAAEGVKPVALELGGKNALIAYPDADPDAVAAGAVAGMNFTWAGQSCGSTSRAFLHASHYDAVLERIVEGTRRFVPGLPSDPATTMGPLVDRTQYERVLRYIEWGKADGARLVAGGGRPQTPGLENGFFVLPTVFADVTMSMRIAREEIFGPVLSVLRWTDEDEVFAMANALDYGLTAAIFTRDLVTAHRAAARVQAGYVWVNQVGPHFLGAPFGGYKQSGLGREECIDELLAYTQVKNVNIRL
jgi:betaine-aldehyde dehydrogenase